MSESTPMRVLSLGGGTQSCALALMSAAGDLPKLDHIIFADTKGEQSSHSLPSNKHGSCPQRHSHGVEHSGQVRAWIVSVGMGGP